MSSTRLPRLAVLIDAENVGHKVAERLMLRLPALGDPIVRRVYGDLSPEAMKGWRDAVRKHALTPCPQYGGVGGKNAADMALAIGAMDLLHSGIIDAFCLVTSDGDFTGLALRLREEGHAVYGVGRNNTPESLRATYRQFMTVESLIAAPPKAQKLTSASKPAPAHEEPQRPLDPAVLLSQMVKVALDEVINKDGAPYLSALGTRLRDNKPGFTHKAFGFPTLSALLMSIGYEVLKNSSGGYVVVQAAGSRHPAKDALAA